MGISDNRLSEMNDKTFPCAPDGCLRIGLLHLTALRSFYSNHQRFVFSVDKKQGFPGYNAVHRLTHIIGFFYVVVDDYTFFKLFKYAAALMQFRI